ncbi:hypothetical protein D0817_23560 [Flavobacterium cupreum]|uniref:Uncharacterized protein n=2 Tax=Flavobacterium TaxID=237 RepID=A0A4Y7UF08_9FLAO|nr:MULTISPECIES: hypothetical protein [Flavobacterium]RUT67992.1 hypothetical protein D0817_23560 [Flavobacterium cupreum]TCN59018.1 hypothetical protein EV142_103467 [Flavobacterium circumlabens]TEB44419.1 hypothetical protein D0809_11755 [Flavobacterium circumlabens]
MKNLKNRFWLRNVVIFILTIVCSNGYNTNDIDDNKTLAFSEITGLSVPVKIVGDMGVNVKSGTCLSIPSIAVANLGTVAAPITFMAEFSFCLKSFKTEQK